MWVNNPKHITVYTTIKIIADQDFFEFPAQLPPLRKGQVEQCLHDFMTKWQQQHWRSCTTSVLPILMLEFPTSASQRQTKEAKYIVKLIDLDRCTTNQNFDLIKYHGEMYENRTLKAWEASRYDWKQLGLLAANVIFKCSHDVVIMDDRVDEDQCLRQLIREGKSWLYINFTVYCTKPHHSKSNQTLHTHVLVTNWLLPFIAREYGTPYPVQVLLMCQNQSLEAILDD